VFGDEAAPAGTAASPDEPVSSNLRRSIRRPLQGLPREVGVLAAVAFCVAAGFGIVAPAIPVFARSFGVSRTAAAGVVSTFALLRLVSAPGVGKLVNRIGERVVLGTGIGIVAVSSALAGLAANYGQLLALRAAGGVGSAMFTVSASSLLLSVTSSGQRGRAMGTFSGGFLLGGIAGPGLGGVVTGWSLRAPFFLYAGTLAVAGAVGIAMLPKRSDADHRASTGRAKSFLTVPQALRMPAFRAAALTNLADNWAALGVRTAIIPLLVVEVLHRSPIWTGIGFTVFTLANVTTLVLGGRLADSRGRRPLLLAGCLGSCAGIALLTLPLSLPLFLCSMAVFGLGSGLLDVAPGAMLGDVVGGRGGTVIAAYQMAGDLGSMCGPLIAGALADSVGYGAAFGVTAAVLLVAAAAAVRAPETLQRDPTP
jgi:DHA1 family multidrug resistance protein-like MFS transporter